MWRNPGILLISCALVLSAARASAQTVTAPSGGANVVASANDFATRTFQDPWDMNERTDVGWWLNSVDNPSHGFSGVSFAGGLFSGTVAADPNLWLLESNSPNLAPIGKNGSAFPLNASVYRVFSVRMCLTNPVAGSYFGFFSSTNTFYEDFTWLGGTVHTPAGCGIYIVDLTTLGAWSGTKRSMRFDPAPDNAPAGSTIDIDWMRLVDLQPGLFRTITWTGSGTVDIYLDNDQNAGNGLLGALATNFNGNSYSLNVGALAPGNYYVAVRRNNPVGSFAYSSGFYQVNAPATITVTAPSDEGSADDFATTFLGDPWDMTNAQDIDHTINLSSSAIQTVTGGETEPGVPLGPFSAFVGVNNSGVFSPAPCQSFSKPAVFPLHSNVRGAVHHIDPTRYRILTAEVGVSSKARDLCGGSIFRVIWHVTGEAQETHSWAVALNSRANANVVNRINLDVAALPIDPASPGQAGWVPGTAAFPGIQTFRLDPHEFAAPTIFYYKRVKLAALETAHLSYTVRWALSKTNGLVNVYYDTDKDPSQKTMIGQVAGSATSMSWNTSGLPHGAQYFVYVEFSDGTNVNGAYAKWPIVIDHSATLPRLVLSRAALNFGVTAVTVKTGPQTVRVTTVNGSPCWTAVPDLTFLVVTPNSGCGTGSFTVTMADQAYNGQLDYTGYIRVSAAGAFNSPQLVRTVVRVRGSSAPPGGFVDTPAEGVAVTGSLGVTGWAIDDIGVARVTICRNPVGGEVGNHPACAPNQIYLGDAVMIDDTRPDLEAASPTTPYNYRAGWGFLVLTNTLPSQGNGAFAIHVHAIDIEGHRAALGTRNIVAQNATANEPFGTIDTPGQGETIGGSIYSNYGWVLSRVRRADPPGGGRVFVYIDGVAVGSPCCWNQRADLTATFPSHPGIQFALGVFGFNTLAYANGLHTISWVVTDNGGVTSGVGSRFFSIFNTQGASTSASAMRPTGADLGRHINDLGGTTSRAPVAVREGFTLVGSTQQIDRGLDGTRRVWATERDRVEIRVGSSARTDDEYAGYLLVDGRLRELPIGSSFDPSRGTFFWQPALGFIGGYDFLFVRTRADGSRERIPVRVTLQPRSSALLASNLGSPWSRVSFSR
jgi:hypothetical protein